MSDQVPNVRNDGVLSSQDVCDQNVCHVRVQGIADSAWMWLDLRG